MGEGSRQRVALLEGRNDFLAVIHQIAYPSVCEQFGPPIEFCLDRDEYALHRIALQIGSDVDHVRQLFKRLESRTALEVHQYKIDDSGIVQHCHRGNQRQQQL